MDADSLEPYNLLKSAIEEGLISHQPASKKSIWSKKFAKSPVSEADNTFCVLLHPSTPLSFLFLLQVTQKSLSLRAKCEIRTLISQSYSTFAAETKKDKNMVNTATFITVTHFSGRPMGREGCWLNPCSIVFTSVRIVVCNRFA